MNPLEKFTDHILHRLEYSGYREREKDDLLEHVSAEYQKYIAEGYDGEAAVAEIIKASGGIDKLCEAFVKKYAYHPLAEFWTVTLHGSMVIGLLYIFTYCIVGFPWLLVGDKLENIYYLYELACYGTVFLIPYTAGMVLYKKGFNGSDLTLMKIILALLVTLICEKTFLFIIGWQDANFLPSLATPKIISLNFFGCLLLGFLSCRLSKRRR